MLNMACGIRYLEAEEEFSWEEEFVRGYCKINYLEYENDPEILTREILEPKIDEILGRIDGLFEKRKNKYVHTQSELELLEVNFSTAYLVLTLLILETGSRLPDELKEKVLKYATWEFDKKRNWLIKKAYDLRPIYLEQFREAVLSHKPGLMHRLPDTRERWVPPPKEDPIVKSIDVMLNALTEPAKVIRLDLSDCNLTSIPDEVFSFPNLKELILSRNNFTSLPKEIGNLTSLEILELSHNKLTTLPDEIGDLRALQKLYLSFNHISNLPTSISKLTSLRLISIYSNPINVDELQAVYPTIYFWY
ncbi:MAG: leucine-rich repeat domain-containing protein [Promethearchaeota archaeon]